MQDAWRVLCVEKMGLHILRDSVNKHSLTDWQLIAHCIHGNSGTLLPTDSIFKKYYIFHFNFSAGFRVWSSHSSSMNKKRSNILSAASLDSIPAPNLQGIPFSKDLVPQQLEETLVRPELCCSSGGAFRWTWVCASCPRSSFRARHLSICNDLPSPHGHNHPLKSWLLTSLILRYLSGFCLEAQESIWRFFALAVPVFGTWLPPMVDIHGLGTRESEHSTSIHLLCFPTSGVMSSVPSQPHCSDFPTIRENTLKPSAKIDPFFL